MIREFIKDILLEKKRKLIKRNFKPQLFTNDQNHNFFAKEGYLHLKNVLSKDEVNEFLNLYEVIKKMNGFEVTDYYFNSISFQDVDIREYVRKETLKIANKFLPRIIDTELAIFPLGGGFCINPPKSIVGCRPHQDPTTVDEIESYAVTIWISLNDMNTKNGCMHIIPGSHLWGNVHRSISLEWAFNPYMDNLWKYMIPIPTKAGDIVCFDVSTIHGSTQNLTDNVRLAVNIPVMPKGLPIKCYYPSNKSNILNKKADLYFIDENYFLKESQFERPSTKYPFIETLNLDNYFSENNINELIDEHKKSKLY